VFHALRASGPVHEGVVHRLIGFPGEAMFQGLPFPDRRHVSVFSFAECDQVFRDATSFGSDPDAHLSEPSEPREFGVFTSMLSMDGVQHRRYRGLVQPSFVPNRAKWWIE
jgi:cytochrome P450